MLQRCRQQEPGLELDRCEEIGLDAAGSVVHRTVRRSVDPVPRGETGLLPEAALTRLLSVDDEGRLHRSVLVADTDTGRTLLRVTDADADAWAGTAVVVDRRGRVTAVRGGAVAWRTTAAGDGRRGWDVVTGSGWACVQSRSGGATRVVRLSDGSARSTGTVDCGPEASGTAARTAVVDGAVVDVRASGATAFDPRSRRSWSVDDVDRVISGAGLATLSRPAAWERWRPGAPRRRLDLRSPRDGSVVATAMVADLPWRDFARADGAVVLSGPWTFVVRAP